MCKITLWAKIYLKTVSYKSFAKPIDASFYMLKQFSVFSVFSSSLVNGSPEVSVYFTLPASGLLLTLHGPKVWYCTCTSLSLFRWVGSLYQVTKYWCFSYSNNLSNEYSGLISFRIDWLDLLAVQRTLKSLLTALQLERISSSVLSPFSVPTLTCLHDYWKNHSSDYTDFCWQSDSSDFLIYC